MNNPSRSIINGHFHFHAPVLQGIILFLLLAAATPIVTAQMSTESSSSPGFAYSNFNLSVSIILAVFISAFFFFMGFLSIYIRFCAVESYNTRRATASQSQQTRTGLDPEVIDSFPIFQYSEVKKLRIGKTESLECAVCITEFEEGDTLRLLPKCDHVFHPDCIDAWLTYHNTCPVCRANHTPSQNELAEETESINSDNWIGLGEEQNQIQNHIQINIDEIPNGEVQVSETLKRNRAGGATFTRSHSTGHSLIQPGENSERYTLRLPVEVRRQMMSQSLKRTISCLVVLPREGSSGMGEGSSRWRHLARSDQWIFSMTPRFLSRTRTSPKVGFESDLTAVVGGSKSFLTTMKTPFDCVAVKIDEVEKTPPRPPV